MSGREELEQAVAYDRDGFEAKAIPYYERAIAAGLDDEQLQKAMLGLGSSLRNVDRVEESVSVLEDAVRRFPDHRHSRPSHARERYARSYPHRCGTHRERPRPADPD